jgi:hypothetical protein
MVINLRVAQNVANFACSSYQQPKISPTWTRLCRKISPRRRCIENEVMFKSIRKSHTCWAVTNWSGMSTCRQCDQLELWARRIRYNVGTSKTSLLRRTGATKTTNQSSWSHCMRCLDRAGWSPRVSVAQARANAQASICSWFNDAFQ